MITHQCDRCAKSVSQKKGDMASLPEGWMVIAPTRFSGPKYELCPKCVEHLGLADKSKKDKTLGEQLISILEQIAEGVTEDCDRCIS